MMQEYWDPTNMVSITEQELVMFIRHMLHTPRGTSTRLKVPPDLNQSNIQRKNSSFPFNFHDTYKNTKSTSQSQYPMDFPSFQKKPFLTRLKIC